jgi:ABC-type phosphate/phosphonate transport system substrate-binding protein
VAAAALPMYDLPELYAATDTWWAGLARALRREGIENVPDKLTRKESTEAVWRLPELLLTQICGYNLVFEEPVPFSYIATPCYSAPGCSGPLYRSHIVVHASSPARTLEDLRGLRCVINGYSSHSGCNALRGAVADLAREGRFFSSVVVSGAHVRSLTLLDNGEADVAAIDCVTYALLVRCRPTAVKNTRIVSQTDAAPVGPYVTRVDIPADIVDRLRSGLMKAMEDPDLTGVRSELLLGGFIVLNSEDHSPISDIESKARQQAYRDFAN